MYGKTKTKKKWKIQFPSVTMKIYKQREDASVK